MNQYHQLTNRAASLTERFYAWELRGRGYDVFNHPVDLEPPLRPFTTRQTAPHPVVDDARRPSLISTIAQRLLPPRQRILQEENANPSSPKRATVTTPDAGSSRIALQLRILQDLKVTPAASEQFLASLAYLPSPISFEIVASSEHIAVQMTCAQSNRAEVFEQIRAYFPDTVIIENLDYLSERWGGGGAHHSIVADFGLAREFIFPFKDAQSFEPDPLIAVIGALASLDRDETGLLQVLWQPARQAWSDAVMQVITDDSGASLFTNAPEALRLARQKISRPLYAAVVRVAAKSLSQERAWRIVKALGGALAQFDDPASNRFVPLSNDGYDDETHRRDIFLRQSHRSGMLLSGRELVSLVHPPSLSVRSEKLLRAAVTSRPAPQISHGHSLVLGENAHRGETRLVTLSADQRMKHTYLIGASGTGKSTLLLNIILQDIERGEGVAVIEPHGDLIWQIVERVPEHRHNDVILLDPADEEYPVGFNIIQANSEQEKALLCSDLVATFQNLATSWGDQMTTILANAVIAFLESARGGTLIDLRRFLIERSFREEFLTTVTDPEIVYYWQQVFPLLTGKPQAPILTRLDTFLRPKLIRRMVGQRKNKIDFRRIMDERKIFLAKLSQGEIGEENSRLLGSMMITKLHQAAIARQAQSESERLAFHVFIDEFHQLITPSLADMLTGVRKYAVALHLAHQDLSQLWKRNVEVASAVLANPYTRICFRVGDFDAEKLTGGFVHFDKLDLQNLSVGEAVARIERAEYDFNLKTYPLPKIDSEEGRKRREHIIMLSRRQYASRREDVEAELLRQLPATPLADLPRTSFRKETPKTRPDQAIHPPSAVEHIGEPSIPSSVKKESVKKTDSAPHEPMQLGRGGQQHRYLQQLIKRLAEDKGYRATIEQSVLGGAGSVDVSLEKEGEKVACEISISSTGEYELKNIQKCLAAGYERVILLASDRRVLNKVKKIASEQLEEESMESVLFLMPEEFLTYLEQMEVESMNKDDTVRGYKVKVRYKAVGGEEKQTRKQAISQVILQAMRRMKKSDE
jgi:hypothetical protein